MPPKQPPASLSLRSPNGRLLAVSSLMIVAFTLFDGTMSFITPIAITEAGFNLAMMGFVISMSSLAGFIFDWWLSRWLRGYTYRLIFCLAFTVAVSFPILIWLDSSLWVFLAAMVVWGLYYDLYHMASYDLVARTMGSRQRSTAAGVTGVFHSLGYLIAPLIVGVAITDSFNHQPLWIALIFLAVAWVLLGALSGMRHFRPARLPSQTMNQPQAQRWWRIIRLVWPLLALTFVMNVIDSTFWTIGPIISVELSHISHWGGFFLLAYQLPSVIVGWWVGRIANRLGKKRTAFISYGLGCLLLTGMAFTTQPIMLIAIAFVSSICFSLTWPAIGSAFTDYMAEAKEHDKDLSAIQDSFVNLGYIVGPLLAGVLGQAIGTTTGMAMLGVIGFVGVIILAWHTPRHISMKSLQTLND